MVFSKKWLKNHPQFLLHFLIHIDVLKLCRKFESISTSSYNHFLKTPNFGKIPCTIAHGFSKKWLKNHPQFLLHFLIHIDVLKLCRKFESIPTSIFRVMTTF